jgi:hypothetical protein
VGDFGFVMPENIAKNTDLCPQARYSTGQLLRKRAENGLKLQERPACSREEFGFEVAG